MNGFNPEALMSELRRTYKKREPDIMSKEWDGEKLSVFSPPPKRRKKVVRYVEACSDRLGHTGGRKHEGHDGCIKQRKRTEAQIRQANVAPEKTKRYRLRMAAANSTGR